MNKPSDWDKIEAFTGDYEKLPAGGYACWIVNAEVVNSKSGREMLKIAADICEGEHKDFYRRQYEQQKQSGKDAKWRCYYYQLTDDDAMSRFKGLIMNIEKSNPGYKWDWNENSLKGRKFGGVFGEEEYINRSNNIATSTKLLFVRDINGIENVIPPAVKKLNNSFADLGTQMHQDEEIPF